MATSTSDYLLDFRREEKPEGGVHIKAGTYKCKIGKTKVMRSSQKGTIGLAVPCIIIEGKYRKKTIVEKLWRSPKAFHRFRELLEAAGKKAPKARADIRAIGKAVEGEEMYIKFVDDVDDTGQYDTKSVVAFQGGFISPDDYEDDDADEDDEDDEDVDDDEDDDDLEDVEDDDDENDDEEDEPPAKRKKRRAPKADNKRKSAKRRRKSSDDDDEDDDDIDLGDFE